MNTIFLKIGVLLDLISIEEILKWSDKNIIDNHTNDLFLDLSSLNKSNNIKLKIINLLEKFEKEITEEKFKQFERVLFIFLLKNIKNWKFVQKQLVIYFDIKYKTTNYDDEFSFRLKDDYFLRKDGFSGCMKMPNELRLFLEERTLNKDIKENFFDIVIKEFI